jgi:rubrerythrin
VEDAMKIKILTGMLIIVATVFMMGSSTTRNGASMNKTTMDNLSTAMHGEAFAYAKYMLYAEQARQNGNAELATLFETAARTERFEHFREEAQLAGLVGSDAENLQNAIKGESYEVDTMYREFAKQAAAAGDTAAADRFEEIRRDEMKHRDEFTAALAQMGKKSAPGN